MKIELNDEAVDSVIAQALDQKIKAIKSELKNNKKILKKGTYEMLALVEEDIKNDEVLLNAMQIIKDYYSVTTK
jgi:hypothetical protein